MTAAAVRRKRLLAAALVVCGIIGLALPGPAATPLRDEARVINGASLPPGVGSLEAFRRLKLDDMVLTAIPRTKAEALAVARTCAQNSVFLCFSDLLYRGGFDLCWAWRERVPRDRFFSRADMEDIIKTAGPYYFGRYVVGEIGCVSTRPKNTPPSFSTNTGRTCRRRARREKPEMPTSPTSRNSLISSGGSSGPARSSMSMRA
jgi:hypothetical protein